MLNKATASSNNNDLEALVFLYHNQQCTRGNFEMDIMDKKCLDDTES